MCLRGPFRTIVLPIILCLAMAPVWGADFVQVGNQITCGQARFNVMSTTLIRMQYGSITDAPTAIVTNRSMSTKQFKANDKNGWLHVSTPRVLLRYRVGSAILIQRIFEPYGRTRQATTNGVLAYTTTKTWVG